MANEHDATGHRHHGRRTNWVLIGFLAIGGYFLVTEHRAHLLPFLGYLPFLLLLACPLMHLFHHGGHRGHASGQAEAGNGRDGGSQRRQSPPTKGEP